MQELKGIATHIDRCERELQKQTSALAKTADSGKVDEYKKALEQRQHIILSLVLMWKHRQRSQARHKHNQIKYKRLTKENEELVTKIRSLERQALQDQLLACSAPNSIDAVNSQGDSPEEYECPGPATGISVGAEEPAICATTENRTTTTDGQELAMDTQQSTFEEPPPPPPPPAAEKRCPVESSKAKTPPKRSSQRIAAKIMTTTVVVDKSGDTDPTPQQVTPKRKTKRTNGVERQQPVSMDTSIDMDADAAEVTMCSPINESALKEQSLMDLEDFETFEQTSLENIQSPGEDGHSASGSFFGGGAADDDDAGDANDDWF